MFSIMDNEHWDLMLKAESIEGGWQTRSHQNQILLLHEDLAKRVKRQATKWEKIIVNSMSEQGLVYEIQDSQISS